MTSHREAPEISKDPVADNTDIYAFVSPDDHDSVTLIANFIPLEEPAGGPNFYQFGDDVRYEIKIDNDGDSKEEITYRFRFKTVIRNEETFLYNTGPINSIEDKDWNIRQFYRITKITKDRDGHEKHEIIGDKLLTVPNRIGPRSTPKYESLVEQAIHTLDDGVKVFAGQRDEGFYVDLGSIFDLATLRPFQDKHVIPTPAAKGKDDTKGYNVHSIVIRVPKKHLTKDGSDPKDPKDPKSTIGVWASASRRQVKILPDEHDKKAIRTGPYVQVSRLAMPLVNEVLIALGDKDFWNRQDPEDDEKFLEYYIDPQLQNLLPKLYPNVFPKLAALLTKPLNERKREDLVAILLTGIPAGIINGFQNFTGNKKADLLRLNMAYDPSYSDPNVGKDSPKRLGLLGGDLDGFPNGRRVFDDVVDIELRAIAGATLPLVLKDFVADDAAGLLADRIPEPGNDTRYLETFPYLGNPNEGYEHSHD